MAFALSTDFFCCCCYFVKFCKKLINRAAKTQAGLHFKCANEKLGYVFLIVAGQFVVCLNFFFLFNIKQLKVFSKQ